MIALSVGAVGMALAWLYGGENGLAGMAMGLGGTAFNTWALWRIIGLSSRSAGDLASHKFGAIMIVLGFFVKLPLFVALAILANQMGGAAPGCFLAGLGLVYFCLVGWALAQG